MQFKPVKKGQRQIVAFMFCTINELAIMFEHNNVYK